MGFYDAFNESKAWFPSAYLGIDQGPIILMIENYRSKLLGKCFMKNQQIIDGIRSIESTSVFEYDYNQDKTNFIEVFINDERKINIDLTDLKAVQMANQMVVQALVGDELTIEVYDTAVVPVIQGLPDLWIARAFNNEGIFMSSKSITPGAYKPWIPFAALSHSTLVFPYNKKWLKESGGGGSMSLVVIPSGKE